MRGDEVVSFVAQPDPSTWSRSDMDGVNAWQMAPDFDAARSPLRGMRYVPDRPVADWNDFEKRLRRVFASLAVDVVRLTPHVQTVVWSLNRAGATGFLVQGWFASGQDHRLEIQHGDRGEHIRYIDYPHRPDCGEHIATDTLQALRDGGIAHPSELNYDGLVLPPAAEFGGLRLGLTRDHRH
ncbi:hypothetical protein ABZ412_05865 [Nocardia sp. NPDC005746]|uniref:hypothetical protein n=1 Tax=Nocardia sp. NPDC005746 TaxID=3157062 RepID=UPI0033F3CD2E